MKKIYTTLDIKSVSQMVDQNFLLQILKQVVLEDLYFLEKCQLNISSKVKMIYFVEL